MLKRLISLCLATASGAAIAANQVLVVDDIHSHVQSGAGKSPQPYSVRAGERIDIDASSYKFKFPASWPQQPLNSLQLVLANDQQFSASWEPETAKLELSARTLTPNPGSKAFAGFKAGQKGVVAIGSMIGNQFSVVWVGMFEVK